mmetsp:Transcript_41062/g.90079  ORF Transcript_41062/g.90079 Transcript_41062/m.90079 type:complete len:354 (+) Transcript_41062:293-1354(+)
MVVLMSRSSARLPADFADAGEGALQRLWVGPLRVQVGVLVLERQLLRLLLLLVVKGDHRLLLVLAHDGLALRRARPLLLQLGDHLGLVILADVVREQLLFLQLLVKAPERRGAAVEHLHGSGALELLALLENLPDQIVIWQAHRVRDHHGAADVVHSLLQRLGRRRPLHLNLPLGDERAAVLDGSLDHSGDLVSRCVACAPLGRVWPVVWPALGAAARRDGAGADVVVLKQRRLVIEALLFWRLHWPMLSERARSIGQARELMSQIVDLDHLRQDCIHLSCSWCLVQEGVLVGALHMQQHHILRSRQANLATISALAATGTSGGAGVQMSCAVGEGGRAGGGSCACADVTVGR